MRNIRRKNYIKRLFCFGEQEDILMWIHSYIHNNIRHWGKMGNGYSQTFKIPVGGLKQNKNSLNKIIDKIKNSFKI